MQVPDTHYVERPDGVAIAYQVLGDGPVDLVLVPGYISHLDLQWTDPGFSRFLSRMASFSRLVLYDKPGIGLSDSLPYIPTVEERAADIAIVSRAAGFERSALLGFSEGGSACALYAATHPDRVTSLVLYGSFAKGRVTREELAELGSRIGATLTFEQYETTVERALEVYEHWGEGRSRDIFAPSQKSEVQRRFWAVFERAAASPARARAIGEAALAVDVTAALPLIQAPTLVLHRTGDALPVDTGRHMASEIPGARFVELPGVDHAFWLGDFDPIVDEIEQFLTGSCRVAPTERVLATVVFTDIVDSTARAAELGDAAWRRLLEDLDRAVREEVHAFGGRVVKSTGDGHLITFDGPARAVRCAQAACARARSVALELRAGVHTGECEIIGEDIGGLAVHIGARVSALAGADEVLVSSTVKDLVVGSGLEFTDRGTHALKGVPGDWHIFGLSDGTGAPAPVSVAKDHFQPGDRLAMAVARRAPRTMRAATRLLQRQAH
ncbi:MAG: adenylate/guanylate cyclase domain-containing protein [Solirubrobacteraceae bacterium]